MSCTKWHQPLKDLLVSSQQSQISFSLLSQPLFLVVTVSTAPLRQPEATVAGGWLAGKRQGFIPAFTGTDSALGLRNNSGLEHCQTMSSEEGRVAVQEPACCGVTRLRTPAQPPTVSILGTHRAVDDTFCTAGEGQIPSPQPRGTPFDFWWLSTSRVSNSRNPGCTPGCTEPRGCGNASSSFYTIRSIIVFLLAQKY